MRAAIAHRHAKALRRAEHHIGAQLAGRRQQHQAEDVGADAGQCLLGMQLLDQRLDIADLAVGIRVLQQATEYLMVAEVIRRIDHHLETKGFGAGLHHGNGLRVAVLVDEEQVALALGHALGHGHGLGRRGGFIEQRGTGQVEAGQVDAQLLEIQQRLQAALGDFRLVRGIGGIPTRVFQHVAQNHCRRQGAVVAHADQAGPQLILRGITAELGQCGLLVQRGRQGQRRLQVNGGRYGLSDQGGTAVQPQALQHGLLLGGIRPQVALQEGIGLLQLGQRRILRHAG